MKGFGPDILQEVKRQVLKVRENSRVAQSRQKSYTDHRRRELRASPMRGLHCFKAHGKLITIFIGPFKLLEKGGEVAYQLELPP
jgi:hypothetical protein